MRSKTNIDVAIACVLYDVAQRICRTCCPIATPVSDGVSDNRISILVKCQRLVCPHRCSRQRHVDASWVGLWCLQCACQAFSILLVEDRLLVKLVVQRVGKEVATSYKVCGALDRPVADNGNLRRTRRAGSQSHRAGAVRVDRHRVVGGQRQQRVILVDGNVGCRQDLEGKRVRACAACGKDHPAGHVVNWHAHSSTPSYENCTKSSRLVIESVCLAQL